MRTSQYLICRTDQSISEQMASNQAKIPSPSARPCFAGGNVVPSILKLLLLLNLLVIDGGMLASATTPLLIMTFVLSSSSSTAYAPDASSFASSSDKQDRQSPEVGRRAASDGGTPSTIVARSVVQRQNAHPSSNPLGP